MTTFFQAWRRRQANRQAAEWEEEKAAARAAVADAPPWIRSDVSRLVETLIDGADSEIEGALDELWRVLEIDTQLRESFWRLRIVDDAVEFLKS